MTWLDGDTESNDQQPQVEGSIGRDCGKNQGNSKSKDKGKFVNDWLLEGFVVADNAVLDLESYSL